MGEKAGLPGQAAGNDIAQFFFEPGRVERELPGRIEAGNQVGEILEPGGLIERNPDVVALMARRLIPRWLAAA